MHTVLYIDAGTGSMLLAAIASGGAGLWYLIRSKYYALKRRVTGGKEIEVAVDPEEEKSASL